MNLPFTRCRFVILIAVFIALISVPSSAQPQPDSKVFSALQWRLIGPFRAGRVTAVSGVPGDPNIFYFGTPGGGVWKTNDGGQVWRPIFDKERVASIGALAVAPSNPRIIYVGTGEQTRGRGLYRSDDGGATWKSSGLEDVLFIQQIVIDPRNPDVVVVAANSLGMGLLWQPLPRWAYTANRGIFKTTDGGRTWKKVFNDDKSVGAVDMCSDPGNPRTLYAVIYHAASGSGESRTEATSEIIRSNDEGFTWSPLKTPGVGQNVSQEKTLQEKASAAKALPQKAAAGKGLRENALPENALPEKARGRMGIAVAPGTGGRRLYAIVDQGFFRSDDAGASWQQSTKDPRIIGSPYFSRIFVDPNHADVLYVAQTSMYRSIDGGRTFAAFIGAPSGDDFHLLWIDPKDSARMISGVDQGAIISQNGGKTWSSWYNQPTGQFYHVSTDNLFPYRVYGAQQDSGTAGVLSRSDYGEILAQDWYSMGGFEYAIIAPDPWEPNFVFSGGWYGSVVRFDKTTGQVATVFERGKKYRAAQMPPLAFSPHDRNVLYLGMQSVLKTEDNGATWQEISPDLTGYVEKPEPEGKADPGRRRPAAITALSPSAAKPGEIWVGTSNRRVYLTLDSGGNWQNVTPPDLQEPTQVLYVEPSHQDAGTAYLTVGGTRESTPSYVSRTHDYGKTWQKIINGIPENEMVRVVRADPARKSLLYAGTDTGVFISWDDGDNWQPFSLNLPATPITDLEVHGDDLVISTFGRGMWILDDVTALREPQLMRALLPAPVAMRWRWDNYQDTPYPIETPAGQNPPDGEIFDYYLDKSELGPLTLTIYDDKGAEVAAFSSQPKTLDLPPANVPEYWFAPPTKLPTANGVNRFVWNLRYPAPLTLPFGYYGELLDYTEYTLADHAIPGQTPRQQPRGPLVVPGQYTAELKYGSNTRRAAFKIELDPRVRASQEDLVAQGDLALQITRGMRSSYDFYNQVAALQKALAELQKASSGDAKLKDAAAQMEKKIDSLQKGTSTAPGFGPINRDLARLIFSVENADMRPAQTVTAAVEQNCDLLEKDLQAWQQLNKDDIPHFNASFANKGTALPVMTERGSGSGCRQ